MTLPMVPDGLVMAPGEGRTLVTPAQQVTFKATGEHSRAASSFEVVVPPGFDVGAHLHTRSEELFYVLQRLKHRHPSETPVSSPPNTAGWGTPTRKTSQRATPRT
ncbi:cupin, partial [Streptomyces violascens]